MLNQEFSNEFDILYNNISSNQAPGLDEYEKSVFLTKAQEEIVLELYSGKNTLGEYFEKTEELRECLSSLIKTASLTKSNTGNPSTLSTNSIIFNKEEDIWFIVHESVKYSFPKYNNEEIIVTPITHDEYSRIIRNPFKGPCLNRVLRLDISDKIELISSYDIESYTVRYVTKLSPIILTDLGELTIQNSNEKTECKLHPMLHRAILDRAVLLAKTSMGLQNQGNK